MRNLIGRLLDRTPQELDRIAALWGVRLSGSDRYSDVAAIYRELTDIWATRDIWDGLPVDNRTVVLAMARGPDGPASPEELAERTGIDRDSVTECLRNLYRLGIVALEDAAADADNESDPKLYLPREIATTIERVAAEREATFDRAISLEELLATVPYIEIEEAASYWGARVTPGIHARAELIDIIVRQLQRPDRINEALRTAPESSARIWESVKDAGGEVPFDSIRSGGDLDERELRDAVRHLGERLLLWHRYAGNERRLTIPDDVLNPRPPEPTPLPELTIVPPDQVYEPGWIFPQAAAWDLLTLLREANRASPRSSAMFDGDPTIQRRLRDRLWWADVDSSMLPTGYLPFITRIGALLGVLQDLGGRIVPGPEAEPWRNSAFTTAARRMVAAWTGADDWIEGRDRVDLATYGASWPVFRGTLLRAVAALDSADWTDQESFVNYLLASEPDLLRQAQVGSAPSSQMTMRVDRSPEPVDRRAEIIRLALNTTLETACAWLGIIERAQQLGERRGVFRVTPFGRWIGGREPEPSAQHIGPAPLGVGANLQILLYRPTPRRVWALSAFSEIRALDRVSTFDLTSNAVIRALASNVEVADIVNFLERQSGQALPQTVRYTLDEWDSGYHRVWLQRAVILTPEDDGDNDRIIAALDEAGLDARRLPDGTLALIHDVGDATERIFDRATMALRERGFAPLSRAPERRGG